MNWNEQADTMMKAWMEGQKKIWGNWYDVTQTTQSPPSFFSAEIVSQWQKMAAKNIEAWVANSDPTAKDVAQRILSAQETMIRFFEFSANAWQNIAAKMEAGEDWQAALTSYTEDLRQQMAEAVDQVYKGSGSSAEMWSLYMDQFEKFSQPWLDSWKQAPDQVKEGNGTAFLELTKLYRDTYDQTIGRLLSAPQVGQHRELNEKLLAGFQAWQNYQQTNFEYQTVLADAWVKAFEALQKELIAHSEKKEPIESLEQLANVWYNTADTVFVELFESDPYIELQGQLLNTTMAYQIHRREIFELFLKMNDLPTRTEMDDAHRRSYEQRKQIKALKKAIAKGTPATTDDSETVKSLRQEVKNLTQQVATLTKAQEDVEILRAELKNLSETVSSISDLPEGEQLSEVASSVTEAQENVEALRKEVKSLAQAVAESSKPKRRKRASAAKKAAQESEEGG